VAIFFGAIIFSGGFYFKVLHGQLGINKFWLKHYSEYGASYTQTPTGQGEQIHTLVQKKSNSGADIKSLWSRTKRANPLCWLLNLNPYNPFALVVILLLLVAIEGGWEWVFLQWSLLTLVFYYVAKYFRFLGHYPGRTQFLDYNAFPTALLCSVFVWDTFAYWKAIIVGIALLLAAIQNRRGWLRVRRFSRSDDQSLLEEFFDYLRKSPKDGVICLPSSHTYAIPYFTGKKVFYTMSARNYEKLAAFFPVLKVPVKELSKEYDINFVIVDKTIVPLSALDLSSFKPVMERNDYLLLEKSE